jgi:DNA N-6-adenine-methyltransferase (Dam)
MSIESLYRKQNDDWETPLWLKGIFEEWFDPCPLHGSGGLEKEWGKKTFANIPYSEPTPWVDKAIEENKLGKTIVLLIKLDPSTKWFLKLQASGAHFVTFFGRLKFSAKDAAPFPSALAILPPPKTTEVVR